MHSRIRIRAFIIFCIVYFCIPQFQAMKWWEQTKGALNTMAENGRQAVANINHTVDQLAGMTKRIELFAHGFSTRAAQINPPEILIPFLTKMAPRNPSLIDTVGWAKTAQNRATESRNLRDAFFEELHKIFTYQMPAKPKEVIDVSGYSINVTHLNGIETPQELHNPDRVVTVHDVKPAMKELAFHLIHQEIEGYKGGEIIGEPALRIGAALYQALLFVDAAQYKYVEEEDDIHLAYPDKFKLKQQPSTVEGKQSPNPRENKQEPTPVEISTVRKKKMHEITLTFDSTWETFKSIMYILGNYQIHFYDAKADGYEKFKALKRREAEEEKRAKAAERDLRH